jgi:hypothetical protein
VGSMQDGGRICPYRAVRAQGRRRAGAGRRISELVGAVGCRTPDLQVRAGRGRRGGRQRSQRGAARGGAQGAAQ